jgi:hypothetical protein
VLSAVLRWRYDHLVNILHGEPEKNVHIKLRTEDDVQRLLRDELSPVRQQLASLSEAVGAISGQPQQKHEPGERHRRA